MVRRRSATAWWRRNRVTHHHRRRTRALCRRAASCGGGGGGRRRRRGRGLHAHHRLPYGSPSCRSSNGATTTTTCLLQPSGRENRGMLFRMMMLMMMVIGLQRLRVRRMTRCRGSSCGSRAEGRNRTVAPALRWGPLPSSAERLFAWVLCCSLQRRKELGRIVLQRQVPRSTAVPSSYDSSACFARITTRFNNQRGLQHRAVDEEVRGGAIERRTFEAAYRRALIRQRHRWGHG